MLVKSSTLGNVYGHNSMIWIIVFETSDIFNDVDGDVREADEDDLYMKERGYSCYTYSDLCYETDNE